METCKLNECNRPQGLGTWLRIRQHKNLPGQVIPVCEEHWQAIRSVPYLEVVRS